jgi:hypothetical protein
MKFHWLILAAAAAVAAACWAGVAIGFLLKPGLALWTLLVTAAAVSSEALLWVAAGVFGWAFLDKRRAALARLRDRLFGGRKNESGAP